MKLSPSFDYMLGMVSCKGGECGNMVVFQLPLLIAQCIAFIALYIAVVLQLPLLIAQFIAFIALSIAVVHIRYHSDSQITYVIGN